MTARQELSLQRVGLASPDNSDTQYYTRQQWWARPARPVWPVRQLRRSYKLHICGIGGGPGAGGVTGCTVTVAAPVEDWRRRAAARVEDRSRRTSREPAAGVMNRRRSGERSDSESRSLRTAGLGQPAGPIHSPAPTGVRRGTPDGHDWIGSKAVEITGSRVGRHPRVAVTRVLIHALGALVITPRDITSHGSRSPYLRD